MAEWVCDKTKCIGNCMEHREPSDASAGYDRSQQFMAPTNRFALNPWNEICQLWTDATNGKHEWRKLKGISETEREIGIRS